MSESLTGVKMKKSGMFLASERSSRDTIRGNAIEISLYLFIGERAKQARHSQG